MGKVVELMVDGRTRILFDSGTEHRYKPASMHKLTLADPRAKLRAMQRCAWSAATLALTPTLALTQPSPLSPLPPSSPP